MVFRTEFLASTIVAFAMGCVTGPLNGEDIGDFDDNVSFTGYISGQGDKACVYANDAPTGTFGYVNDDTASSSGTPKWGITGYSFSVSDNIPGSSWKCNLPLDGTAKSWVKIQESDAAGCLGNYSAAQDDLEYTYDTGSNLFGCFSGNSTWSEYWDDCPVSDDAPVIEVNADRTATYPTGCGAECSTGANCSDSDDCTQDVCSGNYICSNPDEPDGTSCSGGTNYICESGECVRPLCEDVQSLLDAHSCASGETAYQAYPAVWPGGIACAVNPPAAYCFLACGNAFQFWAAYDTQSKCEGASPNYVWYAVNPGAICSGGAPADCRPRNQP